ncbi:MAG: hypothetical protein NC320_05620 [Clostridium sp.]|nr:hypothetical protein [Clostridium sp.]MCM1547478.1 hypothetical protein [Ruminococcus sp.]
MGMSDNQFKAYLRLIIKDITDIKNVATETNADIKIVAEIDELLKTLNDSLKD